jgi:hypothetical protein
MRFGIMQKKTLWRTLAVLVCALVFFFALHAKTSMYSGSGVNLTPSTASKLWLSGQKIETQSLQSDVGLLFWIAALYLFILFIQREHWEYSACLSPAHSDLRLRYLHRFLRPPPVQQ